MKTEIVTTKGNKAKKIGIKRADHLIREKLRKCCLIGESIREKAKGYFPVFATSLIFSIVLYSCLMAKGLVNQYDGIWNYSYKFAGTFELSLGRWLLAFADKVWKGLHIDPVTSVITLIFCVLGMILLLDIFQVRGYISYLICGLFLSNVVVCNTLSYRYTSASYGMAFFFSMLAVFMMVKSKAGFADILMGAVSIAVSMGLYQAYLGCTCVVCLGYFMFLLKEQKIRFSTIGHKLFKCILTFVSGGVLYFLGLRFFLIKNGVVMSSYRGGDSASLLNTIVKLPVSALKAYQEFASYYSDRSIRTNYLSVEKTYWVVLGAFLLILILTAVKIWKKDSIRALIFAGCIFLIPLGCSAVLFIATETGMSIQMTAPLALCLPLLLCIVCGDMELSVADKGLRYFTYLMLCAVLYGCAVQTLYDQNGMAEGQTSAAGLAEQVLNRLDQEGSLSADKTYCFVGRPADNELFYSSPAFEMANGYAAFGRWGLDANGMCQGWRGVIKHLCGCQIKICDSTQYSNIIEQNRKDITRMSVFPATDSIMEKDGVVIVKISDAY